MSEQELLDDHPGVLLDLMSLPKDLKFSKAQMEAIEYADFERFTANNGWEYPSRNGNFHHSSSEKGDAYTEFPAERLADYAIRVGEAIRSFAEADERSMMSVYLELRWKIRES